MSSLPVEDLKHIADNLKDCFGALKNKSILLTGGTGFFGQWLVESLDYLNQHQNLGLKVTVLTRDPDRAQKKYQRLSLPLSYYGCDLSHREDKIELAGSYDFIIHAGNEARWPVNADDELELFNCIVNGTQKILEFAEQARTERFLYVSSGAAAEVSSLTNLQARTYAESKRMAEVLTQIYASKHKMIAPVARCYSFVGPHLPLDKHYAVGNFLNQALQGKSIEIQSDGQSIRSYLYAADLTLWLLKTLLQGQSETIYEIGSEEELSIKQIAQKIQVHFPNVKVSVLNKESLKTKYVPQSESTREALQLPSPTSFDIALSKTISWFANQNL